MCRHALARATVGTLGCSVLLVHTGIAEEAQPLVTSPWQPGDTEQQIGNVTGNTLQRSLSDVQDPRAPPGNPGWLKDDKEGAPGVPAWLPGQRWYDALRGFVHLLHEGYDTSRHDVAVFSASFLARAFPVKGLELRRLAQELDLHGRASVRDWTPQLFRMTLDQWARGQGLQNSNQYTTCEGNLCVMWTLLHITLTAVAARGISGRMLLGDGSIGGDTDAGKDLVGIGEAIEFVKQFVEAFLPCKRCKDHFIQDFNSCSYGRCEVEDYRGLTLWFWRVHNAVSLRVANRHGNKVDRRWPMYADCPTCWRESLVLGEETISHVVPAVYTTEDVEAPFHKNRVFWHMVRTYIGVQRVSFDLSDLSPEEQSEVKAVLAREHAMAAGEPQPMPHNRLRPRLYEEPPPRGRANGVILAAILTLVCSLGLGAGALYALHTSQPGSSTRVPQFHRPHLDSSGNLEREGTQELEEDDEGSPQKTAHARDDTPAAE
eukprot:CAMPEP_0172727542 /NCGR_PEP_ID=MMETSP1074-20121228/91737_1 /TAXON_ID=2916 /ORGANISM="Ceratium fusus, Strain PA161109" /LENGTH=486 /DNA_ID=CAMNT_0013554705 /DNA_START=20 /DNA_END=1480 /DNA_ORIENTATION=+